MPAQREIEVEATPEEVWEALTTEEGRERWLEDDPAREIHVELADEPSRLVWWWWSGDEPATRVEFLVVAAPAGRARGRHRDDAELPAHDVRVGVRARVRLSRDPGPVFAALADPTRRRMVEQLLRDGSTSVPALTAALPITRQAVAKHLATLGEAGLVERVPGPGARCSTACGRARSRLRHRGCARPRRRGTTACRA